LQVAGVTDDQVSAQHGLGEPGAQIVENRDPMSLFGELTGDMAAYVASATGYQYLVTHECLPSRIQFEVNAVTRHQLMHGFDSTYCFTK